MKDGNSCRPPVENSYADTNGDEQSCSASPAIPNILKLGGQAVQVANRDSCPFTCTTGYIPAGRFCITQPIALGEKHTCAILNDGSLKCWGYNHKGQLGLGNKTQYDSPEVVNLGVGNTAKAIAAGNNHTCAILNDDNLKCWGKNNEGQLGLGDSGRGTERTVPEAVSLGTGKTAKALAAGELHICAILNDNSVKCWGENTYGKLGLGPSTDIYNTPQAVNLGNNTTAKAIAAGEKHTCAILNDNSVKCWGYNGQGQLGLGNKIAFRSPQAVSLGVGKTAKALAAGSYHTCAIFKR